MSTHRLPILYNVVPDTTADCWLEPYSILATNDVWRHIIGRFGASNAAQPTVRAGMYGSFVVPKNYVSAANLVIYWSATLTSGNVVWDFDYRTVGGDDTTSLDQAGTEQAVTATDTAPGAANRLLQLVIDLTDANFAADDLVEFFIARDGADAADTMAGSAIMHAALFEYADV